MPYATIEDRVDRLEALFGQFLTQVALLNKRADERHKAAEQRQQAAEERAEERHRTAEERNRLAEERMTRFEAEMREFREESRAERREMNRRWGDLANKLGTIIEDILAPNLRRLARDHFHLDPIDQFITRWVVRKPGPGRIQTEYDVVVVGPEAVILGEAKSTPTLQDVEKFAAKVATFFEFVPQYAGRRLIPVLGSWAMSDEVVDALTVQRIYALRMGEEAMELANATTLEGR